MPVDPQAGLQPPRTGDHPYPCSERPVLHIAPWAIAHGYCRTSLDLHPPADKIGSSPMQLEQARDDVVRIIRAQIEAKKATA